MINSNTQDSSFAFRFPYVTLTDTTMEDAHSLFRAGQGDVRHAANAERVLAGFSVLNMWRSFIANRVGASVNSPSVNHAYWIGNEILDQHFDYAPLNQEMLRRFPHLSDRFFFSPSIEVPHHNLHVRTYGIVSNPSASESEKEDCLVHPATLLSDVLARNIAFDDSDAYHLRNPFGLEVARGNSVAVHRGVACARLESKEVDALLKYGYHLSGG